MADRQTAKRPHDDLMEAGQFQARRGTTTRRQADDLHVCPSCESHLVYPLDWEPGPANRWRVELRCPDCEWHGGGVYSQDTVDRFDEELDRGTEDLLGDLEALSRANLEEQIERFVTALAADRILPEDF